MKQSKMEVIEVTEDYMYNTEDISKLSIGDIRIKNPTPIIRELMKQIKDGLVYTGYTDQEPNHGLITFKWKPEMGFNKKLYIIEGEVK